MSFSMGWRLPRLPTIAIRRRWHPTLNYIATAAGNVTGSLWIHQFTEPFTLTMTTNVLIQANPAFAVAWRPSGGHLAAGIRRAAGELVVYTFSGGGFSTSVTQDMSGLGRDIQQDALDWNPRADSNLAVGLNYPSSTPEELAIYRFSGANLQLTSEVSFLASARAIHWSPSSNFLAVGLSALADANHIRIYSYPSSNAILSERVSLAETQDVYAMDWSPAGNMLAVGLELRRWAGIPSVPL